MWCFDPATAEVDYDDTRFTQNTRCSYPIEYIDNAKVPCTGGHPKNIVFLTCDAFGVLPPVSKLTPEQAMYHFVSGYTAKVAGTENRRNRSRGNLQCLFWSGFPRLASDGFMQNCWRKKFVSIGSMSGWSTPGWTGGGYGTGHRISLKHTRAIIDSILDGRLGKTATTEEKTFGLAIPKKVDGLPLKMLRPENTWQSKKSFETTAKKLARMFRENFKEYERQASRQVLTAAPKI